MSFSPRPDLAVGGTDELQMAIDKFEDQVRSRLTPRFHAVSDLYWL